MESETKVERWELPLTPEQFQIVVLALEVYYEKTHRRILRRTKHYPDEEGRHKKDSQELANIQECLQFVTLIHNIRTGKLNPDVAEAAGIPMTYEGEEKDTSSTGESERDGS